MAENRWRSATVASLCVQARLNKRYFYESFDDLDRLADAVIDSVAADVGGAAVAAYLATLDSPLEVQAKNTVGALVDVLGTDRRKALVLLGGVPTSAGQEDTRRAAIGGLTTILVDHARRIHDVELNKTLWPSRPRRLSSAVPHRRSCRGSTATFRSSAIS